MGTVLLIIAKCKSHCSEKVLFFHVQDVKPVVSDHAIITTKIYIGMPQTYVMNSESPFLFSNALG